MPVAIIENEYTQFVEPLEFESLKGRVLHMPAKRGRAVTSLVVYGHHASLERYGGFADILNDYGEVYMPDLPGLGGMSSFYSTGRKPTLDAFADYLAAFIRTHLDSKQLHVFGVSFGFIVATRMLQRHPDLADQVELVVSIVGFVHNNDFKLSAPLRRIMALTASACSHQPLRSVVRYAWLNAPTIRLIARTISDDRSHFRTGSPETIRRTLDYEVYLWHVNDLRTHWNTMRQFFEFDNTGTRIDAPVWHISADSDTYFDAERVRAHLEQVYASVRTETIHTPSHAPSILGARKDLEVLFPSTLKTYFDSL